MGKPVYTKLLITAFVTALAFGGFAALNFYLFRGLIVRVPTEENILYIQPENGRPMPPPIHLERGEGKHTRNRNHSDNLGSFILKNSLFITGAMLLIWLINIGILLLIERTTLQPIYRKLLRYAGSYILISVLLAGCIYLVIQKEQLPAFGGSNGPMNILPTPSFRMRLEWTQLPFITAIVINTIVSAMLELVLTQHHKSEIELENTRLKMTHLLARHQHLQHQLQPHFLFNSLNTLKSLIRASPAGAEEYLLRLSFFLRSSLTQHEQALIPLADEVQFCCYYLEMQKIRYGDAFKYELQLPDEMIVTTQVPAFSLQLLAENAIKHNALTIEKPLRIQITGNEEGFIFVRNNKQAKAIKEPSSFTGLKNLSERYKMVAGDAIEVTDNEQEFIVKIKALPT